MHGECTNIVCSPWFVKFGQFKRYLLRHLAGIGIVQIPGKLTAATTGNEWSGKLHQLETETPLTLHYSIHRQQCRECDDYKQWKVLRVSIYLSIYISIYIYIYVCIYIYIYIHTPCYVNSDRNETETLTGVTRQDIKLQMKWLGLFMKFLVTLKYTLGIIFLYPENHCVRQLFGPGCTLCHYFYCIPSDNCPICSFQLQLISMNVLVNV